MASLAQFTSHSLFPGAKVRMAKYPAPSRSVRVAQRSTAVSLRMVLVSSFISVARDSFDSSFINIGKAGPISTAPISAAVSIRIVLVCQLHQNR